MPKSRNRKGHKKAVAAYKNSIKERRNAFEKQMKLMNEKYQQEMMEKEIAQGTVASETVEGLNVDDFKLDVEPELEFENQSNFGIVQGVTNPNEV